MTHEKPAYKLSEDERSKLVLLDEAPRGYVYFVAFKTDYYANLLNERHAYAHRDARSTVRASLVEMRGNGRIVKIGWCKSLAWRLGELNSPYWLAAQHIEAWRAENVQHGFLSPEEKIGIAERLLPIDFLMAFGAANPRGLENHIHRELSEERLLVHQSTELFYLTEKGFNKAQSAVTKWKGE